MTPEVTHGGTQFDTDLGGKTGGSVQRQSRLRRTFTATMGWETLSKRRERATTAQSSHSMTFKAEV